jgi:uncharacterized protein (TIGR03000 family)
MAKQIVRLALCAALALYGGSLFAGGETENKGGPTVKTTPTEKGRESKIHVYCPCEDCKVYFNDTLTKATGLDRTFRSPALEDGKRYTYKVVASWVEKGQTVTHETKVVFQAGQDVAVDFRR